LDLTALRFIAKTMTPEKCFCWNYQGLIAMRDATKSPFLNAYWKCVILMSLKSTTVLHHLKKNDTLYDSLMIPVHKSWLDGAPSRGVWKQPADYVNWQHSKEQFEVMKSAFGLVPPRLMATPVSTRDGINPKQAYIELLCRTAEQEEMMTNDSQITSFIASKRQSAIASTQAMQESDGPPSNIFQLSDLSV
jgi:hypothetical protein